MSYLDTINAKKTATQARNTEVGDLDSLISQLKEVQLASLMGASKSTVVLADSTDFGQKMAELGDKITTSLEEYRKDTRNADKIISISEDLKSLIKNIAQSNIDQKKEIQATFDRFISSVESIKLPEPKEVKIPAFPKMPTIPAPIVNVPAVDLSPIGEAIASLKEEKEIDLEDYRAHDIDNSDKNVQYIGFVSPEGGWYIIENNVKENSIRYLFGQNNYSQAFASAATYEYRLLSEAVDAIQA